MVKNHDFTGISAYASCQFAGRFSIFSRYDYLLFLNSDDDLTWSLNKDVQLFMAGFDYSPVQGVKFAPVFLSSFKPGLNQVTSTISLNIEIRL
jgi:hypothetical protein